MEPIERIVAELFTVNAGNIGENRVVRSCLDLSTSPDETVLSVRSGSPQLFADLLLNGFKVVFVHHEQRVLGYAEDVTKRLLSKHTPLLEHFWTECWPLEANMAGLATEASIIVALGALHHQLVPLQVFQQLLSAHKPIVLLDTTSEMMNKLILEETSQDPYVYGSYISCRNETYRVGFNRKEDIVSFLEESGIRELDSLEYPLQCNWCGDEMCVHNGSSCWIIKCMAQS